ncbi:MAG: hypothetical protein IJ141_00850 [Lachnospiraceae bacterium]|nr:hypothetical protein [Lachnospiraceae bacterium]
MSIFEFDEELYKKSIREESFEAGLEKGLEQGRAESRAVIEQKDAEIERLKKLLKEKQ